MIREYKETDLEELLDVWYLSSSMAHPFLTESFMKKEKNNIREIYIPNTKTWIVEDEEDMNGFISMIGNEVGAIFVRPKKHGQGIGKKLMDHAKQFHEELEVEVFRNNKIGTAFYNKYGFKTIKEHIHEETNQKLLRMTFRNKSFK